MAQTAGRVVADAVRAKGGASTEAATAAASAVRKHGGTAEAQADAAGAAVMRYGGTPAEAMAAARVVATGTTAADVVFDHGGTVDEAALAAGDAVRRRSGSPDAEAEAMESAMGRLSRPGSPSILTESSLRESAAMRDAGGRLGKEEAVVTPRTAEGLLEQAQGAAALVQRAEQQVAEARARQEREEEERRRGEAREREVRVF